MRTRGSRRIRFTFQVSSESGVDAVTLRRLADRIGVTPMALYRHVAGKGDGNPAARVYESIGPDFFLAVAPSWLNLGLWEGPGTESEAEQACRRLVGTLASALPTGGCSWMWGMGLAPRSA